MVTLMAFAAQALCCAVKELHAVVVVRLDVMDNVRGDGEPLGETMLAQWLRPELMASKPAPLAMVIGTASVMLWHRADAGTGGDSAHVFIRTIED
jgi:hypothetical protein